MVILLIALQLIFPEHIQCSGRGEIQFLTYTNPNSTDCGEGDNGCDFYFKNVLIEDEDGNELHRVAETDDTSNSETVNFANVNLLDEAFTINIPAGKRIKISLEVWDKDGTWNDDDRERDWADLVVPFSRTKATNKWVEQDYESNDNQATLKIQYKLTRCNNHFAGLGCNRYCIPMAGYYKCSTSGQKVCEDRRTGNDCGTCITGFTGQGCQLCAENYYPEGTCDVHCPPNPGKYTCTDQGEIECLVNRRGSDCELCVTNHYGEDCSKFCQQTSNYKCDESGDKDCEEHYYPEQKCDTNCKPVPGNYTCNQAGEKICEEGKTGEDCDECQNSNKEGRNCEKCIEYHYGEDCTIHCEPDYEYYDCSESGNKICLDNTTSAANNCMKPGQERHNSEQSNKMNIPLIGAAGGGGGLLLILLVTVILLKVRKDRNKNVTDEILVGGEETDYPQRNQDQEAVYSTVNKQPVYSTVNKQPAHSSEGTQEVYSRINREGHENEQKRDTQIQLDQNQDAVYSTVQSEPSYSTVDKQDAYARLDRHGGRSNEAHSAQTEEGETYADVAFVKNRRRDDVVTYRSTAQSVGDTAIGRDEDEVTYITVSQVVEDKL